MKFQLFQLVGLLGFFSAAEAGGISRIKKVIVLMMENRSFDHLLGYLKGVDGIQNAPASVPRDPNDLSKGSVPITDNGYDVAPDDPFHDMDAIAAQINNNGMDGFVWTQLNAPELEGKRAQNESTPVAMFTPDAAPIINTLAQEYAVFDSFFCSIPGPTDPNRQFAQSGTSLGIVTNFNGTLYKQQSYIDYLRSNGHTSGGYFQDDLWQLGAYEDLVYNPLNAMNIKDMDSNFYKDLADGSLPEYSWLQPRMNSHGPHRGPTWQHPDASVIEGERLIKDLYEAIVASPTWNETLFIITYDENGGFYDHVAPPDTGVPAPDDHVGENGFTFHQLGVRVPTLAISPWIEKGTIVHGDDKWTSKPFKTSQYDATSVMATINEIFGVTAPPLGRRMAWASRFTNLLTESDLSEPRTDCPTTLPDLPENGSAMERIAIQRQKPINEHIEASMLMFCSQNYPTEFVPGVLCPSAQAAAANQGTASDWMHHEQIKFFAAQRERFASL